MTMLFVVFAVAMAMHAMASAATPLTAEQLAQRDAALRHAGEEYNSQLSACRDKARQEPSASRRDRITCERAARKQLRQDVRQARAD
ncbi:hypothetical protein [uncultured Ramlibacter sp.]|uniref:hypothetical protein n=1 Tax=uncultured Ramlibacter sp. TaxID=260755 RepID=UPI002635481D|nr:hypothetical protein [uncultured Ramlibacter sp.]